MPTAARTRPWHARQPGPKSTGGPVDMAPVPNRWQPSADARCAILRRPGVVPARPRAELDDVLAGDERKKIDRARIHGEHWPAKLQLELIGDELDVLVDIETVRFVLRRTNADLE